jgi:rfaE bifunctional protein nucleotidyltransferase chain/domain
LAVTVRDIGSKILTREEAVARLSRQARGSRTLAMANGCFDVLHVGHVRYLQASKLEGDILLVAVNSDASVGKLKGEGRPLQCEEDRAELIASLSCVDFVTVFPEETVAPLIRLLEPDVQCKGTDYTEHSVPEREEVVAHGGRVAIVGDPKDHDSSAIIRKLERGGGT